METGVEGIEIVVHRTNWVTDEGYVCLKWPAYYVAVGKNPRGPRGGRNGKVMDAVFVGGRFRTYEDASNFAEHLLKRLAADESRALMLVARAGRMARPL